MEKKILFVDDERDILNALVTIFKSCGFEARSTMNAHEAMEIVKFEGVRVCFLDLRMPDIDGMELCGQIKHQEPKAKVFALSAFIDAYTPDQFKAAGFEAAFSKPFKVDALMNAAKKAFEMLELGL